MLDRLLSLAVMGQAGGEGGVPFLGSPIFLVVLIVVMFYFVLYKPEKKRKEEREKMLKSLDRGDEVITAGGLIGRITNLNDEVVTVEVAPNVKVKVSRNHVSLMGVKEKSDNKSEKKK